MTNANEGAFGSDTAPSLKFPTVGTRYRCLVTATPKRVQSINFETKAPDFWPPNADGSRNPKMVIVTRVEVEGEAFNLWATDPSALCIAIKAAQQGSGRAIDVGSILDVTYTHDEASSKGAHLNPAKQFAVVHTPPNNVGAFATPPATQATATYPPTLTIGSAVEAPPWPGANTTSTSVGAPGMTPQQEAALRAAGLDPATFAASR